MDLFITFEIIVEAYAKMLQAMPIQVFLFLVGMDILTGLAKGLANKNLNSTKGVLGIVKHLLIVLLVVTVYPYLTILGANAIAIAFVLFFIGSYGISVIENYGQLDLPMPSFVKAYFEKLKRDNDNVNGGQ